MLYDAAFVGRNPRDSPASVAEILRLSTGYSPIAEVPGETTSDILHTPEDIAAGSPREMMEPALRDGAGSVAEGLAPAREALLAEVRECLGEKGMEEPWQPS